MQCIQTYLIKIERSNNGQGFGSYDAIEKSQSLKEQEFLFPDDVPPTNLQ